MIFDHFLHHFILFYNERINNELTFFVAILQSQVATFQIVLNLLLLGTLYFTWVLATWPSHKWTNETTPTHLQRKHINLIPVTLLLLLLLLGLLVGWPKIASAKITPAGYFWSWFNRFFEIHCGQSWGQTFNSVRGYSSRVTAWLEMGSGFFCRLLGWLTGWLADQAFWPYMEQVADDMYVVRKRNMKNRELKVFNSGFLWSKKGDYI